MCFVQFFNHIFILKYKVNFFYKIKLINQLRNTNRGAAPATEPQIQNLPVVNLDQALLGSYFLSL
jgi:hypothetical protein